MSSRRSRRRRARLAAGAALVLSLAALALSLAALHSLASCCLRLSVVATGSMEPSVPRYSLVLVKRDYPGWIPLGEVVLYRFPGTREYVLHRLVDARLGDGLYTKGDAAEEGEPVEPGQVWGVLVAGLPRAAYAPLRLATDPGAVFLASLLVAAIVAGTLVSRLG